MYGDNFSVGADVYGGPPISLDGAHTGKVEEGPAVAIVATRATSHRLVTDQRRRRLNSIKNHYHPMVGNVVR